MTAFGLPAPNLLINSPWAHGASNSVPTIGKAYVTSDGITVNPAPMFMTKKAITSHPMAKTNHFLKRGSTYKSKTILNQHLVIHIRNFFTRPLALVIIITSSPIQNHHLCLDVLNHHTSHIRHNVTPIVHLLIIGQKIIVDNDIWQQEPQVDHEQAIRHPTPSGIPHCTEIDDSLSPIHSHAYFPYAPNYESSAMR